VRLLPCTKVATLNASRAQFHDIGYEPLYHYLRILHVLLSQFPVLFFFAKAFLAAIMLPTTELGLLVPRLLGNQDGFVGLGLIQDDSHLLGDHDKDYSIES